MDRSSARVVTVEIAGHRFPIRSDLDPAYVTALAEYVEERIRAASRESSLDTLRVVVLAALNIADEYFRCRDLTSAESLRLRERAERLERLVDGALDG